jgi:hypothetical protein
MQVHRRNQPHIPSQLSLQSASAGAPSAASPLNGSSLDAPAKPATVTLNAGELKIETSDSDLGEILKSVATQSGMTIDGTVRSARVFGVYGPGKPTEVLTDLLSGAGYNFIMIGGLSDGAPRELMLSARNGGPPVAAGSRPNAGVSIDDDSDANEQDEQPGPGAVIHAPPPGPEDPHVRMEQNLQRLQQMHDEQERQQQQNQPQ